ncbi:MAG: hypothetical protein LC754_06115 [Acidobacteria bacterium]|nr:hypothetical protein [Acidobacteriota bacterium]
MSNENAGPEDEFTRTLASNVTTTGLQPPVHAPGENGVEEVEVVAVGAATGQAVTFQFMGSFDNVNFYVMGYRELDNQASPMRSVSPITLTPGAGNIRAVYGFLDNYPYLRINVTANTLAGAGAGMTANLYAMSE